MSDFVHKKNKLRCLVGACYGLFVVERLFPQALDTFGQQRHYLVHIAYDTQVGYAEYGSKLIFVDGNDIFALFHTRQVLYSSRYAARQVQLGTHGLTRLPHLSTVVYDACVDHSTRGTHLGTYLGG